MRRSCRCCSAWRVASCAWRSRAPPCVFHPRRLWRSCGIRSHAGHHALRVGRDTLVRRRGTPAPSGVLVSSAIMVARDTGKLTREQRTRIAFRPSREDTLVETLVSHAGFAFGRRNWSHLQRELVVGSSIADLVLFSRGSSASSIAKPLSVPESVILSLLRRKTTASPRELARLFGRTDIRRALRRLSSLGFIRLSDERVGVVRRWWAASSVVAIEAKLVRWRVALDQASAYRAYADLAYVALPEAHVAPAYAAAADFLSAGVGLISVSAGSATRLLDARPATNHDWRREFACSRLAAASS